MPPDAVGETLGTPARRGKGDIQNSRHPLTASREIPAVPLSVSGRGPSVVALGHSLIALGHSLIGTAKGTFLKCFDGGQSGMSPYLPHTNLPEEAKCEANRPVLMLPAPVENPVLVELNALAASIAASPAPQPLPLTKQPGTRLDPSRAA